MESYLELSVGGVGLQLSHIQLLPEERVQEWKRLTLLAEQKMGPISTGVGLVGSIGWVAAGSLILGAIEQAATSSAQREGLEALIKAKAIYDEFDDQQRAVPVADIQGLRTAEPFAWRGRVQSEVEIDIRTLTRAEVAALHTAHRKDGAVADSVALPTQLMDASYVLASSEFISAVCRTRGVVQFRWSSVDTYRLVPNLAGASNDRC